MRNCFVYVFMLALLSGCGTSGQYIVKSQPTGAEILVDGEKLGTTPATISVDFPENKQLVREKRLISLRLKGYREAKEVLCYEGDQARVLNFELEPDRN
ncbi:PEGA domain-containing protein [Geobacter argillaceus]|uniref:PEGA domain-containing protein n=1 Tax=Geobacter argillaceus TaxID=345631 RepID=A0A562VM56_9BACT|nr:PEGA domain-containing protein [Geobacter argillaceus]TWJ19053.1 PEGA domain-containing protein [Geobacter argillaceus]